MHWTEIEVLVYLFAFLEKDKGCFYFYALHFICFLICDFTFIKIHDCSAKPTTETSTEHVTKRPTILTTLSSIASVTIDTELPVPMETLNMSDYKQGEPIP